MEQEKWIKGQMMDQCYDLGEEQERNPKSTFTYKHLMAPQTSNTRTSKHTFTINLSPAKDRMQPEGI